MTTTSEAETPVAVSLMLCDQVIVDKDTNKPSPIGIFTRLGVENFEESQRFSVFVVLANGRGQGTLELETVRLDTGEPIYRQTYSSSFPDPPLVVNVNIRVRQIVFPAAGWYDFIFRVNAEVVAQRRIEVYSLTPGS